MSLKKETIYHSTPSKNLVLVRHSTIISLNSINTDKVFFGELCKQGCSNFGCKHSCPPHSPHFNRFSKKHNKMEIICYQLDLSQYATLSIYSRIRAGNAVLKSKVDKYLYEMKESGFKVAGSGSCRACKPCAAKTIEKCKKPHKLIYSLESLGVDVNHLVETCFGFPLQWYRKGEIEPEYTCTVAGVLLK
jgi:predicted metal-binding protein